MELQYLNKVWGVEPLTEGQAACVSTMSYNEYWVVRDAGYSPEQLTVFKYQAEGASTLKTVYMFWRKILLMIALKIRWFVLLERQ